MASKNNKYVNLCFASILIIIAIACISNILLNLKIADSTIGVAEGTFPFSISILLFILGILIIIEEIFKKREMEVKNIFTKKETLYAFYVFCPLVVCVLLFPIIGFVGAMGMYTFIHMTYVTQEKKGLLYRISCTILIPSLVFLLFKFLYITLPQPFWIL